MSKSKDELRFSLNCLVQVTEDDKLPKIMCGECSYKLDLLSDFRDKAYKTETHFLSEVEVKIEVYTLVFN
jgi:DNA-directed RNA polymerase subunit RPC12/RpoP